MSIMYITENDKNGRARFYKVIDGKKKVVSRSEYEAQKNVIDETVAEESDTREIEESQQFTLDDVEKSNDSQMKSDVLIDVGEFLLNFAKEIITAAGSKNAEKTKLQKTKTGKRLLVNYRNCMVFSVALGTDGKVESLRFMGTTDDTRKTGYEFVMNSEEEISSYKDEIIKQVDYIDRWYLNSSPKKKAS